MIFKVVKTQRAEVARFDNLEHLQSYLGMFRSYVEGGHFQLHVEVESFTGTLPPAQDKT